MSAQSPAPYSGGSGPLAFGDAQKIEEEKISTFNIENNQAIIDHENIDIELVPPPLEDSLLLHDIEPTNSGNQLEDYLDAELDTQHKSP